MSSQFIPSFHFESPEKKLKPEWCKKSIDYYWYNSNVKSLLWDKKIALIEEFFTGDIKMDRFMSMFKSMKRKYDTKLKETGRYIIANDDIDVDIQNIIFQEYPQIQNKVNAVISLTQKIPIEINCTAIDASAMKKRKEDIEFLKNKPALEADLDDLAAQMGLPPVDLGKTKHSSTKFGDSPFGMDLNDPDDEKTFTDLMYALNVETAFEQALEIVKEIKNFRQIKLLETKDQVKYAINTNRGFRSTITGLPDAEYVWPGSVYTAPSNLPDFSDNDARFMEKRMTIMEMYNCFSNEICGEETLEQLINAPDTGYCFCNNLQSIGDKNFTSAKVNLVYCEVKSVDYVGVYSNPKSKKGFYSFTENPEKCTDKIWGQNTYCFWWLKNTKHFFGIDKLDYAHRSKGNESYQNFSINIYKSNSKSAVELSIGQNIKAQIAEIKINFAVLMAKADGYYVDIRGMRNAALTLKDADYTAQKLMELFTEKNVIIADTEGFEGKNDGQFKPFIPIEGGIKNIISYLQAQESADRKIDKIFGTNDSLTGASQNADALIGVEKLRIDASINALYYITEALEVNYQKLYNIVANCIQASIKEGGKVKQAVIDWIGVDDVDLLSGLNEIPLHNLTIKITFTQREQERAYYQQRLNYLIAQGAVTLTEEYLLSSISNPKRRFAELARIENRYRKEQEQIRQEQFAQAQQLQDQRNQGMVGAENARTEGNIKQIYTKGEVEGKILQLASQLGMNDAQAQFFMKRALQQDRGQDQYRKALDTVREKQTTKMLEPLAIS